MQQSAASELQSILAVPPDNFVGDRNNPGTVAHASLQTIRDTGDVRFLFLRTIIELQRELSKHEELVFHCLTGCRQVVLQKWTALSLQFRTALRDFLLSIGFRVDTPRLIQLACFTTSASFWKRQWTDREEKTQPASSEEQVLIEGMLAGSQPMSIASHEDLMRNVESLLQPNSPQFGLAATFLSVLAGEFMGKSAVRYHLPLEFHKRAHANFEKQGGLDSCLRLGMGALSVVVSALSSQTPSTIDERKSLAVVQLTTDIIGWEFGADAWDVSVPQTSGKTLIRPPVSWREHLTRPDFCGAIFRVHEVVVRSHENLAASLRQLLLLLASLSGPMFENAEQRKQFANYLMEGTLKLIMSFSASTETQETSELVDALSIVGRLVANFKLSVLVELPTLSPLLSALTSVGTALLQGNVQECREMQGDVESMEHKDWRDEAIALLLEAVVLMCDDPWLLYSGDEATRRNSQLALASTLGPLYNAFVTCRVQMAKLEEAYITLRAAELDEVREEISAADLEEEMGSVASIGRLSLSSALSCLSALCQPPLQQLKGLWEAPTNSDISPDGAALLEETRLLTLCLGHLLTDKNEGETPVIPESIVMACQGDQNTANAIGAAVTGMVTLAQLQAARLAQNPFDPLLSPLLATSFLWFFKRWAPGYILPFDYTTRSGNEPSPVLSLWANHEAAQQAMSFCASLCLQYQCYWPQERQVQEAATLLITSLAKRESLRVLLVASPAFQQMTSFHCITAGLRHSASTAEMEATLRERTTESSLAMAAGYHRLPYMERAKILTAILVATCDKRDPTANAMFKESLSSVQTAFSMLSQALRANQVSPDDINAKEMACLCVELYGGVARASEAKEIDRFVDFITPALPELSALMQYYAKDRTVCEGLLRFFRDYTEHFVVLLNRQQSTSLFNASAELLRSYSAQHCTSRVVGRKPGQDDLSQEEEYSDILCAIQLLIHLGTKDFIDICSASEDGVDSQQVTDIIFFGLQQIIPLMNQGLLQFPTLCSYYFSLVGFMMDTYPDKVCLLPYDLFDALLQSLLYGMNHTDKGIAKSSMQGIAGVAKEHMKTHVLNGHLAAHPDIFDRCSTWLLQQVVFQSIVWDRLESAGMALLALAAVDMNRFVIVVNNLTQGVSAEHQPRLNAAFQKLMVTDVIAKVATGGHEGRMNRLRFKKDFEEFVKEVHSFLVIK